MIRHNCVMRNDDTQQVNDRLMTAPGMRVLGPLSCRTLTSWKLHPEAQAEGAHQR